MSWYEFGEYEPTEEEIRSIIENRIKPKKVLEIAITRDRRGIVSIAFRTDTDLTDREIESVGVALADLTGRREFKLRRRSMR